MEGLSSGLQRGPLGDRGSELGTGGTRRKSPAAGWELRSWSASLHIPGWQMVKNCPWTDMKRLRGGVQETTSNSGAVSCDYSWPMMSWPLFAGICFLWRKRKWCSERFAKYCTLHGNTFCFIQTVADAEAFCDWICPFKSHKQSIQST